MIPWFDEGPDPHPRLTLATLALLLCAAAAAQPAMDPSPDRTTAEIRYRLDYGLWGDRIRALYDLGELGPSATPLLAYAAEDADWQVRLTAAHFLGKVGEDSIPALANLAGSEPCPYVRVSALKWLDSLGPAGHSRYAHLLTPDDQALIAILPDHYGTQRMGRAVAIDPPDGDLSSSFLNGGIDLRVCASSERSGHKHPPPAANQRETPSVSAPEEPSSPEALPDAAALLKVPLPENPEVKGPEPTHRTAEIDTLITPAGSAESLPLNPAGWTAQIPPGQTQYAATPERRLSATDLSGRSIGQKETFPQGTSGRQEQVLQTETDYAAVPERSLSAMELPGPPIGSSERLPKGAALPTHEAPETAAPGLAPDAGIGKTAEDPVPALIARLALPDPRARARAADELGKRGLAAKQAVRPLRAALKDQDRRVRASAALALGGIGIGGMKVVTDLKRALRDPDEDVRFSARLALDRLGYRAFRPR